MPLDDIESMTQKSEALGSDTEERAAKRRHFSIQIHMSFEAIDDDALEWSEHQPHCAMNARHDAMHHACLGQPQSSHAPKSFELFFDDLSTDQMTKF